MDPRERVSRLFDAVAESYDAVGVDFFGPIADGLVDALAPRPGEDVVDLGCGRGAVLVRLAEAVGPTGSASGLDLSERMVALTRADASARGLAVDVRVGDAMSPELETAAWDVVASSLVLFFLPDPAAALLAWRELLRPGGRLGVSTFGPYDPRWREDVDALLERHLPPGLADARTSGRRGPFASDEGMEALLADAGLRDVRTVTATVRPRFDDPAHWHQWSLSVGQRQFWESLPADRVDAVTAELYAAVDGCRDADGRIGFDQQVRYTLGTR